MQTCGLLCCMVPVLYRFYYDCLMKPNAKSVTTALRKVADLKYHTIANGHGPVLRWGPVDIGKTSIIKPIMSRTDACKGCA